jgi:hypothetical protein
VSVTVLKGVKVISVSATSGVVTSWPELFERVRRKYPEKVGRFASTNLMDTTAAPGEDRYRYSFGLRQKNTCPACGTTWKMAASRSIITRSRTKSGV